MITNALPNEELSARIPGVVVDLAMLKTYAQIAKATNLSEHKLKDIAKGRQRASSNEGCKIITLCHKYGLFRVLPLHGIPSVAFDISSAFHWDNIPLGSELDPPPIQLRQAKTLIAGYPVDFPLGLPASILSAHSKWVEFFARRGVDILTYKTVRTEPREPHPWPNWVCLKHPPEVNDPSSVPTMIGYPGYWPEGQEDRFSMANSFGIPSLEPQRWQEDLRLTRQAIKEGHQVLIVSIVSSVEEGAAISTMIKDFVTAALKAKDAGAQIIEANYSCPNVQGEHDDLYRYPDISASISKALRDELRGTPLFVKIGYLPKPQLRQFVQSNAPFINGIVAINTISASVENAEGATPFPGRQKAGVSGWAIKARAQEVAQNLVALRDGLKLDPSFALLGLGGVLTQEDYEERKATGVTAVESCTGLFLNPNLGVHIRQLDAKLDTRTVEVECSSATSERKEHIWEDSSQRFPGGIHLPLDGRANEYNPGKGEEDDMSRFPYTASTGFTAVKNVLEPRPDDIVEHALVQASQASAGIESPELEKRLNNLSEALAIKHEEIMKASSWARTALAISVAVLCGVVLFLIIDASAIAAVPFLLATVTSAITGLLAIVAARIFYKVRREAHRQEFLRWSVNDRIEILKEKRELQAS